LQTPDPDDPEANVEVRRAGVQQWEEVQHTYRQGCDRSTPEELVRLLPTLSAFGGLDHGVGHPRNVLATQEYQKRLNSNILEGFGAHSRWPKVANAVIKAPLAIPI